MTSIFRTGIVSLILPRSYNCTACWCCLCTSHRKSDHRPEHDGTDSDNIEEGRSLPSSSSQQSVSTSTLFSFLKLVKYDSLNEQEQVIHNIHIKALENRSETYKDPATGYDVLTRFAHLQRGECCGNACRHCPFGQRGVPADQPKKRFNSAFFV